MKTKTRNILVLACNEDTIVFVQAHSVHDRYEIKQTATLKLPESVTWENTDQLGQTLRQFLRQQHLSARLALVGVPARWVVAKSVHIPPTSQDNVANVLEIQTEQAFSLNHQDLVFDYSGRINATKPNEVLLAAMPRKRLEQIQTVAKIAGLHLLSVTPSVAAMSVLSSGFPGTTYGIYAQNEHCEFITAVGGTVRQIKHISTPLNRENPDTMAAELQRVLLLAGLDYSTGVPMSLVLWSDREDSSPALSRLRQQLDSTVDIHAGREILVDSGRVRVGQMGAEYDGVTGLLLAHTQTDIPLIDFLHSHIGIRSKRHKVRILVWSAVLVCLLLVGLGSVYWGWQQDRRTIQVYEQYIADNSTSYEAVRTVKDNLALAAGWSVGRPRYLSCMRELAQAFPERGDIWVSNMNLKEDLTDPEGYSAGLISGGAIDRPTILNVIDKLKKSGTFSNVEINYTHGGGAEGVSYTIRFKFKSE